MSGQLYQFQPQQSFLDTQDYLIGDLNVRCSDGSSSQINYSQSTSDLPLSYTDISLDYQESSSANMSYYQTDQITGTRQQTTTSSREPVEYSLLIKKPEPIAMTFDQFHALISTTTDRTKTNRNTVSTFLENSTIIGHNIPLKIVHQTNSNSSNESNQPDSLTNNNNTSTTRKRSDGPTRRTSIHNAIEKRYRSSINEKIDELKGIVATSDSKIQKSGILRDTIEYIRRLQSTNQRIEEDNSTLKIILKQLNLTHDDFSSHNHAQSTKRNSPMQNSTSSFDEHSLAEADTPVTRKRKRGAIDRS